MKSYESISIFIENLFLGPALELRQSLAVQNLAPEPLATAGKKKFSQKS